MSTGMKSLLTARLRYWFYIGRHKKQPRRDSWHYPVMSAYELERVAANQHMRLRRGLEQ